MYSSWRGQMTTGITTVMSNSSYAIDRVKKLLDHLDYPGELSVAFQGR